MLDVEFAEISDRGNYREENEDCLGHVVPDTPALVHSQGWLFALADGMGGQEKGEVASRLAIDTALSGFRAMPKGVMHVSLLPRLVQAANAAVYDQGHVAKSGSGGMGTTLVLCALRFDSAVLSHVGDSRCYLFRGGKGIQLTLDHTMVAEQMRLGLMSQAEAQLADSRHILTRSLGNELFVAADTITVNIIPGDILLLCSDGLHGSVSDAIMSQIIESNKDLNVMAQALLATAIELGAEDNISVQLIRIRSVERMGLYRGRPYRLL